MISQKCVVCIRTFRHAFSLPVLLGQETDTSKRQTVNRKRCSNCREEGSGWQRYYNNIINVIYTQGFKGKHEHRNTRYNKRTK